MTAAPPLAISSAHAVFERHARTFSAAARWLPADLRDDIAVVYTFCRTVDDRADDAPDPAWLEQIANELRDGSGVDPIARAFLEVAHRRNLPVAAAVELVRGVQGDLGLVRVADPAELVRYGWRVAGTVGELAATLFGCPDEARPFAIDLGVGMQLTNIARDVGEDAGRDRVYLPSTWLLEAGVDPDDLPRGVADPRAVRDVVGRVLDLADLYYRSGEAGMRFLPFRARLAVVLAARRYHAIGEAVRDRGVLALRERTVLGSASRLRHALATPWHAVRLGFSAEVPHETRLHVPLGAHVALP